MTTKYKTIAFQGMPGAYSDLACQTVYPELKTLPCETFEDTFQAVHDGKADLAMIPVDNTIAGRVADVHHLLPGGGLYIIAEHFQPIHHALLGVKGASIDGLEHVHSHVHALPQCRKLLNSLSAKPHVHADTAGAAQEVAERGDPKHAAIASSFAAEMYGLDVLKEDIQDADHNTTRFLILAANPLTPEVDDEHTYLTSLIFSVRNIPAALYKAMGGFATNDVNMVKLESYIDASFQVAQFYLDVYGHPEDRHLELALEELGFFAKDVTFLGTYPAHPFREQNEKN